MTHEQDHERDQTHAVQAKNADQAVPGRCNTCSSLKAPENPVASGLLHRKARDANGVAEGADQAVAATSTSSGAALPDTLMRKFEDSLGTDLSSVRVHTGAESAVAASAVGAHAYTMGQDIHFAAGQYDPSSSGGQHLLAHEVAHTVQQAGGTPNRQNKLEVSSPGDHLEVEADQAAAAMVAGTPATVTSAGGLARRSIQRCKPGEPGCDKGANAAEHDKNERDGLMWGTGTALEDHEMKQWASDKSKLISVSINWISTATGWQGIGKEAIITKLQADAAARVDGDIQIRKEEIGFVESEIDFLEDEDRTAEQELKLAAYKKQLLGLETELTNIENKRSSELARTATKAREIASTITKYAGDGLSTASVAATQSAAMSPNLFNGLEDWSKKLGKALNVAQFGIQLMDRTSINNFQQNPSFETAAEWGQHVGGLFNSLSALAEGMPPGWDSVIQGCLAMPAIVISNFTSLVRDHYKMVDEMTRDEGHGKGKLLPEGKSEGVE